MKKTFLIIACILCMCSLSAQVIVYGYPVRVSRLYPTYRTYKVPATVVYKEVHVKEVKTETTPTGAICIHVHCAYNFNNAVTVNNYPQLEFGGSLSYYFKANPQFGLIAGYDHGFNQWWIHPCSYRNVVYETRYWNIRAGACISKYWSIGMTYGQYKFEDIYLNDFGVFTNVNIPFIPEFGIFVDGKWTQYQGFSVGGGFFVKIFTK